MSRPSKARHPDKTSRPFYALGFLPLASSRRRVPVPQRLAINPRVLDTSLLPEKALSSTSHFLSDPPRQRYSTRDSRLWKPDSCMVTRSCRISKARPCPHVSSRRGRRREGGVRVCENYVLVSIPASPRPPPSPTPLEEHNTVSAVICDTCV